MAGYRGDLTKALAELDFHPVGTDGEGHLIFRHERAGTMRAAKSTSDWRAIRNYRAVARRRLRLLDDELGEFLTWMRLEHRIPRKGYKDFNGMGLLKQFIRDWANSRPGKADQEKIYSALKAGGTTAARQSEGRTPFFEPLVLPGYKRATGFRIYGRDYLLDDVVEPATNGHDATAELTADDVKAAELPEQSAEQAELPAGAVPLTDVPADLRAILNAGTAALYREERDKRSILIEALRRLEARQEVIQGMLNDLNEQSAEVAREIRETIELGLMELQPS